VNDTKYIGLDVHPATISAAVLDSTGKLVMEAMGRPQRAALSRDQNLQECWEKGLQRRGESIGFETGCTGKDGLVPTQAAIRL
jgi:hypothetical protein